MKKALVIGAGGLGGAYDAGVLVTLYRELGPRYFDAIYASSSGAVTAPFFISGQLETIEKTWRAVAGGLINFRNIFSGRKILDFDHLIHIFQMEKSGLDVKRVFSSDVLLTYVLTAYRSGKSVYVSPRENNIFELMRASAALPFLHGPVYINGIEYIDGSPSDALPLEKALDDGCDEILAVWSIPKHYTDQPLSRLSKILSLVLPRPVAALIQTYEMQLKKKEGLLQSDRRIAIIRPSSPLPLTSFIDTNKDRINVAFDRGTNDARVFIKNLALKKSAA